MPKPPAQNDDRGIHPPGIAAESETSPGFRQSVGVQPADTSSVAVGSHNRIFQLTRTSRSCASLSDWI